MKNLTVHHPATSTSSTSHPPQPLHSLYPATRSCMASTLKTFGPSISEAKAIRTASLLIHSSQLVTTLNPTAFSARDHYLPSIFMALKTSSTSMKLYQAAQQWSSWAIYKANSRCYNPNDSFRRWYASVTWRNQYCKSRLECYTRESRIKKNLSIYLSYWCRPDGGPHQIAVLLSSRLLVYNYTGIISLK